MELSEKIQKLRKEHNMTQEQFAEKLFVSRTAVSKWETGRGMPSMESLQMIAKLFHITLDDLLSTEEIVVIAESENTKMKTAANRVGTAAHIGATILLILCGHPYPAVLFFFLFAMKGILLLKKRQ